MFKYKYLRIQTVASSYERIKEKKRATNYTGGRKKFT